jgi:hypothetical protein
MYKDKDFSSLQKQIRNQEFLDLVKIHINFEKIIVKVKNAIERKLSSSKIKDYIQ